MPEAKRRRTVVSLDRSIAELGGLGLRLVLALLGRRLRGVGPLPDEESEDFRVRGATSKASKLRMLLLLVWKLEVAAERARNELLTRREPLGGGMLDEDEAGALEASTCGMTSSTQTQRSSRTGMSPW
jgi:hypothetical protein